MPSQAYGNYIKAEAGAILLRNTATEPRLRPIPDETKSKYLHASLAAHVAAWDNYLRSAIREYYDRVSDPLDLRYSNSHNIAKNFADDKLSKLNTPNWENARNAIALCTGYDPITDWTWRSAGLSSADVHQFLNEVLRVRHSFAHGFALPQLDWLARTPTRQRLSVESMRKVEKLFSHLVRKTDQGLASHASVVCNGLSIW